MANRPTANTFDNDLSKLWLLKDANIIYRSVLAAAEADKTDKAPVAVKDLYQQYKDLKSMIENTAKEISGDLETYRAELSGSIKAVSDEFGTYTENISTVLTANANQIVEASTKFTSLESGFDNFTESMSGQICRGWIEDPDNPGTDIYGIAISQKRIFTANAAVKNKDGSDYYAIQPRQTFGLYTSEGWQFWIGGQKVGWFDASDRLHVRNEEVEGDIRMGEWSLTDPVDNQGVHTGFGIKYIGS